MPSFVKGLFKAAVQKREYLYRKAERDRKERQEREKREELARARAEKRRRYDEELDRVNNLITDAQNWQLSKLLREYIEKVKSDIEAGRSSYLTQDDLQSSVEWASQQADRLDPLLPNPPSILDEEIEEEPEPEPNPFPWD